jgi:hypothetical protein
MCLKQLPIEIRDSILDNYADVRSYWKQLFSTMVVPELDVIGITLEFAIKKTNSSHYFSMLQDRQKINIAILALSLNDPDYAIKLNDLQNKRKWNRDGISGWEKDAIRWYLRDSYNIIDRQFFIDNGFFSIRGYYEG